MAEKLDRRFYLFGPKKGQPRPSKKTRVRRRGHKAASDRRERWQEAASLTRQHEEAELRDAMTELRVVDEEVVLFRLCEGYRTEKSGATLYPAAVGDECRWFGHLVVLRKEDVRSGRRWICEGYPETWMEEYSKRGREWLASRSVGDAGKNFVEYQGYWYEANEVL